MLKIERSAQVHTHTGKERTHTGKERTHTFQPATTCSTRLGPADSCFRGKMICSAFWFCLMTLSQRDTSLLLRSYATPLWICTHTPNKQTFYKSRSEVTNENAEGAGLAFTSHLNESDVIIIISCLCKFLNR